MPQFWGKAPQFPDRKSFRLILLIARRNKNFLAILVRNKLRAMCCAVRAQSSARGLLYERNVIRSQSIESREHSMARPLQPQSHVVVVDSQPTGYRSLVTLAEAQHWHTPFPDQCPAPRCNSHGGCEPSYG